MKMVDYLMKVLFKLSINICVILSYFHGRSLCIFIHTAVRLVRGTNAGCGKFNVYHDDEAGASVNISFFGFVRSDDSVCSSVAVVKHTVSLISETPI